MRGGSACIAAIYRKPSAATERRSGCVLALSCTPMCLWYMSTPVSRERDDFLLARLLVRHTRESRRISGAFMPLINILDWCSCLKVRGSIELGEYRPRLYVNPHPY